MKKKMNDENKDENDVQKDDEDEIKEKDKENDNKVKIQDKNFQGLFSKDKYMYQEVFKLEKSDKLKFYKSLDN